MKRNLISLSTLDKEGLKYTDSGGVVKVSKGSLVCLMGDLNPSNLYVLRGCTLHGLFLLLMLLMLNLVRLTFGICILDT